ncbi:MAG: Putative membrane protein [Methanoculleus marisnigri]|nr:MAG: Putative membrane protein [Methanoculleus marisnigri]
MVSASGTSRSALVRHAALMLVATAAFALLAVRGTLDALTGGVLLILFVAILFMLLRERREEEGVEIESHGWADALYIGLGLVAVVVGAQLVVNGAVTLAEIFGIPAFVIGVSVVAVGTSLPELATSLVAAVRNEGAISIGNILGSNIFNILLVLGISLLLAPATIGSWIDIIVVVLFSVAILPLLFARPSVVRGWSALLLVGYAAYMAWIFGAVSV